MADRRRICYRKEGADMDKNESFWQAMKNGLPLGAVFFGALVGPVMVTGSYTMNYFLKYGIKGWLICPFYALCIFIWFYCGFTHTRITAESNPDKNVYDYTMLAKALYGKYTFMVPLYDLWILLAMVLTAASTIATGGKLIASFLGSAYVVGAVVMAALVTVVAIFGADIVRKASTVMMFGLIGLIILLLVITFVHKGGALLRYLSSGWEPEACPPLAEGFWRIFILTCGSSSWALGVGSLAQKLKTKKDCVAGAFTAGISGALAFLLMFFIVAAWCDQAAAVESGTPVLNIATEWLAGELPWLPIAYYGLMILALVSSGAPAVFIATQRMKKIFSGLDYEHKDKLYSIIFGTGFCAVVIVLAMTGLNAIVGKYFQYLGYYGQICGIIPMVIIWPILRKKGIRPVIKEK